MEKAGLFTAAAAREMTRAAKREQENPQLAEWLHQAMQGIETSARQGLVCFDMKVPLDEGNLSANEIKWALGSLGYTVRSTETPGSFHERVYISWPEQKEGQKYI